MLAHNLLLSFIGECLFTAYCLRGSQNTVHNVKELFAFCNLQDGQYVTVPPHTYRVDPYAHAVWCGTMNTAHNVQIQIHTVWRQRYSTFLSVMYCIPVIPHLTYQEHGHWKTYLTQIY
jgi:hypothetical protein